ncbi:TM221 protein, partial [Brachypodius atriceps]|nr:TM221 protein [Brachypodius atriceps]
RADRFLLHSRSVRHAALGLFCCGLCLYLTGSIPGIPKSIPFPSLFPALALFMLLLFELEAGIASACILTSGILILLLSVLHALLRASRIPQNPPNSRISRPDPSQALYENDSAQHGSDSNKNPAAPPPGNREFSFPTFLEGKSRP